MLIHTLLRMLRVLKNNEYVYFEIEGRIFKPTMNITRHVNIAVIALEKAE